MGKPLPAAFKKKSLIDRFIEWLACDTQHLNHWLETHYPGFRRRQLANGRWWLWSTQTGMALPELDVQAILHEDSSPVPMSPDRCIELEFLNRYYPGMTKHPARGSPGVWLVWSDKCGETGLRVDVRLAVQARLDVCAVPISPDMIE